MLLRAGGACSIRSSKAQSFSIRLHDDGVLLKAGLLHAQAGAHWAARWAAGPWPLGHSPGSVSFWRPRRCPLHALPVPQSPLSPLFSGPPLLLLPAEVVIWPFAVTAALLCLSSMPLSVAMPFAWTAGRPLVASASEAAPLAVLPAAFFAGASAGAAAGAAGAEGSVNSAASAESSVAALTASASSCAATRLTSRLVGASHVHSTTSASARGRPQEKPPALHSAPHQYDPEETFQTASTH